VKETKEEEAKVKKGKIWKLVSMGTQERLRLNLNLKQ
jgi:hypothetical protein